MIQVTTNEVKKPCFPKLMSFKETKSIFLFIDKDTSICLSPNGTTSFHCGEVNIKSLIDYYTDYNEPVTIQNV